MSSDDYGGASLLFGFLTFLSSLAKSEFTVLVALLSIFFALLAIAHEE